MQGRKKVSREMLLAHHPTPMPPAVTDDVTRAQRGDMQAFERIYFTLLPAEAVRDAQ